MNANLHDVFDAHDNRVPLPERVMAQVRVGESRRAEIEKHSSHGGGGGDVLVKDIFGFLGIILALVVASGLVQLAVEHRAEIVDALIDGASYLAAAWAAVFVVLTLFRRSPVSAAYSLGIPIVRLAGHVIFLVLFGIAFVFHFILYLFGIATVFAVLGGLLAVPFVSPVSGIVDGLLDGVHPLVEAGLLLAWAIASYYLAQWTGSGIGSVLERMRDATENFLTKIKPAPILAR